MSQEASIATSATQRPPFWRDVRVIAIFGQVIFILIVSLVAGFLYANVTSGLDRLGATAGYGFMDRTAGFEISLTPITYSPSDSYWRAFQVGVVNSINVIVVGILLASLVGIVVGISQLSSNWLVAKMAQTYVAIFRNMPLLVQLFFWYQAVFLSLPRVQEAVVFLGPTYLSIRGVSMAGPIPGDTFSIWLGFVGVGLVVSWGVSYWLRRRQDQTGRQSPRFLITCAIVLTSAVVGSIVLQPSPIVWSVPERTGFNFTGGIRLSPEYAALLIGLVAYTGAFIAENVRAGIQGVSKGQTEAARALGLSAGQSMRLVILPQALRIIIPPTTNQYLNLAKNSSLAFAIAYPDLFAVARTIFNQTGQTVQLIGLIMMSYLIISLVTSVLMNLYNRSVRLVER